MEHKLQYLKSVRSTKALPLDIEKFTELILSPEVATNVQLARLALADNDKEQYAVLKQKLPAIMWCGVSESLSRKAETLKPTGLFMVDIDHLKSASPVDVFMDTMRHNEKLDCPWEIVASHTTPSGNGIRFVAVCRPNLTTLRANMDAFVADFHLDEVGDYDSACKDLSRLSFIVPECDWHMYGAAMFEDHETDFLDYGHCEKCCFENEEESNNEGESLQNADSSQLLNEQEEEIKNTATYKNNLVADIAEKYVEVFGTPEQGERHNYYNTMVKNFRLICNNDPKILHAVLPRFGNSYDETRKQCQGICRSNMVTRLPREFYLFLRQNGFYPLQSDTILTQPKEDEQEEEQKEEIPLPVLPPIFREFCSVCPKDFTLPTIDALLPILGTLTSYLRADYYDGMEQSTSFYTVLYAPPSSSKSFVKRLMDPLFHLIYARDEVATLRENIYIDEVNAKGANDKSPDDPHVAVRIMPVINSQAEFLTKMKDNKGYHMFTFAEEVDSFVKGTKAAGGDKSDLLRIAWDNGKYGQAFKGKGTFKGTISLYYNVLMTGTPAQVLRCYKDVENGMATRVTICEIENQSFASFPVWKKLSKRQNAIIENFVTKCDEKTYSDPLNFDLNEVTFLEPEAFKTEVPWRFEYRMHQFIDMTWLKSTIGKWLEAERIKALQSMDFARDTWRKRTAVMGFRLGMICTQLWQNFTAKEQKIAKDFILWWMDREMENALKFFAPAFNDLMNKEERGKIHNENIFNALPDEFETSCLIPLMSKNGMKTRGVYMILNRWKKSGLIEKAVKDDKKYWSKVKK